MAQQEEPKIQLDVKRFTLAKFEGDFVPGKEPIAMITGGDNVPTILLARLDIAKLSKEDMAVLEDLIVKGAPTPGTSIPTWDDALAHSRKPADG